MALESIYKLSVIMNMIDRMTGPSVAVSRAVGNTSQAVQTYSHRMAQVATDSAVLLATGTQITKAMLSPVKSIYGTQNALAELSSLGVEALDEIETAAQSFSDTWAGTTKAEFITAAYDIKSGIASLSDAAVADYTRIAGITAKATKATTGEMTSLFATGYGIYKDYYADLSDLEFGEMFSGGIAQSVKQFKTNGSQMAAAIEALGGSATSASVPLEEQLSILGMLQATMGGSEAGTKYTAFLQNAAKAGEELGLRFTDASGNLKAMPEILGLLKNKFGETMTAADKIELQKAFGTVEAVKLIELLYGNIDDLQGNILTLYDTMGQGMKVTEEMANKINAPPGQSWERFNQKLNDTKEIVGNAMLPTFMEMLDQLHKGADAVSRLATEHPKLISTVLYTVAALGGLLATLGGLGMIAGTVGAGWNGLMAILGMGSKILPGIKYGLFLLKYGLFILKGALTPVIASVWSFTTALLANPVTWIVIGILLLVAAIILLWRNWDSVTAWCQGAWNTFVGGIAEGFQQVKDWFGALPDWLQYAIMAFLPFIGIPLWIINNWDQIGPYMANLWGNVTTTFSNGIQRIKDFFTGLPEWFRKSGAGLLEAFSNGIQSMVEKPVAVVSDALQRIRKLLPFSDAKEGPLSDLTLSGSRVFTTWDEGMQQTADVPARTMEKALDFTGGAGGAFGSGDGSGGQRQTVIEKLILAIDLKDIDEFKKLKALLLEIEDETNGSIEIDPNIALEG
ncbi:MAG TPA: phage tail tape measure protein, partial [Clostridia bacterium]|nr:phage tail tape measure protein [Clostridia bacterium]